MEIRDKHHQDIDKLKKHYQEKCEKIQYKYNQITDQAKNYGVYFLEKLDKHEAECEKDNEEKTKELMVAIQLEAKSNQDLTHAYNSLKKDHE